MFIKNCPSCDSEMDFVSEKGLKDSVKRNSLCKKCRGDICSNRMKGRKVSEESKLKMSLAKIGKKLTQTHKDKIGKSCRGKVRTEESKKRYSESKIGDKNPTKRQDVKDKIRNSVLKLYKENPEIKDKISKSVIDYFNNNQNYVRLEDLNEYEKFRNEVEKMTKRLRKELFDSWDGIDYYDGEFIGDNINLDYNDGSYPTIDHKIPIIKGFKSGMTAMEIASIDNLCITKRKINTKKGFLNESDFIEKLKNELGA